MWASHTGGDNLEIVKALLGDRILLLLVLRVILAEKHKLWNEKSGQWFLSFSTEQNQKKICAIQINDLVRKDQPFLALL